MPDGWIFDENGWCVLIESKVLIALKTSQIIAHRHTAKRRGFREAVAVALVPYKLRSYPADIVTIEWRDVYSWLCRHRFEKEWAARAAKFLEVTETRLIETKQFREGTLTRFTGIPFSHENPYAYLEAKRVLGLALEELRARSDLKKQLGMNPSLEGRGAVTGTRADAVWNFLSLSNERDAAQFTRYPHLTLGITAVATEVMVTVPNAVSGRIKHKLKELGEEGFRTLAEHIVRNMRPLLRRHPGATPWFRGVQRRYKSQRAIP